MLEEYSDLLTANHLQEILQVSKNVVYRMLQNKEIASLMCAGKYRIPKKALIEYIQKNSGLC